MPINTCMWILPMQHVSVCTLSASHVHWLHSIRYEEWPYRFWGTNSHRSVGLKVWSSSALLIQISQAEPSKYELEPRRQVQGTNRLAEDPPIPKHSPVERQLPAVTE